jgi:hypothetical protein
MTTRNADEGPTSMPSPPPKTTPRLFGRGGWLLYLALAACPLGKLAVLAVAGSAFGITLDNPYLVGAVLLSVLTAGGLLTRRAVRRRNSRAVGLTPYPGSGSTMRPCEAPSGIAMAHRPGHARPAPRALTALWPPARNREGGETPWGVRRQSRLLSR